MRAVIFLFMEKLFLVEYGCCDLINKSDNACEHDNELKKFGNCHSLSPPLLREKPPTVLCRHP